MRIPPINLPSFHRPKVSFGHEKTTIVLKKCMFLVILSCGEDGAVLRFDPRIPDNSQQKLLQKTTGTEQTHQRNPLSLYTIDVSVTRPHFAVAGQSNKAYIYDLSLWAFNIIFLVHIWTFFDIIQCWGLEKNFRMVKVFDRQTSEISLFFFLLFNFSWHNSWYQSIKSMKQNVRFVSPVAMKKLKKKIWNFTKYFFYRFGCIFFRTEDTRTNFPETVFFQL